MESPFVLFTETPPRRLSDRADRASLTDEVRGSALLAGCPTGRRPCTVDSVEAAVVDVPPGPATVGADVATGGADRDCRVSVDPDCPRAVLRGAGHELPVATAVTAQREVVRRGGRQGEVAADGEAVPLAAEGEGEDAGRRPAVHRRRAHLPRP